MEGTQGQREDQKDGVNMRTQGGLGRGLLQHQQVISTEPNGR